MEDDFSNELIFFVKINEYKPFFARIIQKRVQRIQADIYQLNKPKKEELLQTQAIKPFIKL